MNKRHVFLAVVIILFIGLHSLAYGISGKSKKADVVQKEMTREEMLAELREDIADNDELFDAVPGLKAAVDKSGKTVYSYKNMVIDELSKEDLDNLCVKVNRALVKIRADRIQRQLETTRQVEAMQRAVNPPSVPAAPPSAPKTPTPPSPAPQRR